MALKNKQFSLILALGVGLIWLAQPRVAGAQTLEAELGRVDKLRKTFGDEFVSGLTNLPPKKYFAARDQALALADQVVAGSLARADAKKSLCDSFAKNGGNGCPALSAESADVAETTVPAQNAVPAETAVSAVKKTPSTSDEELSAVGEALPLSAETEQAPAEPVRAPRSTKVSQIEEVLPDGPSISNEPEFEPGNKSAVTEPDLNPTETDHVSAPKPRRSREPELESDTPDAPTEAGRHVSSEVPLSPEDPQS